MDRQIKTNKQTETSLTKTKLTLGSDEYGAAEACELGSCRHSIHQTEVEANEAE